jgi:DNA-directed RNA polymerase specialized sigma24 family protein
VESESRARARERLRDYACYRQRLIGLAVRRGLNPAAAEDIAHDALLRSATTRTSIVGEPWPFIAAIANNLVTDHFRRVSRVAFLPRGTRRTFADFELARRALRHLRDHESHETIALIAAWATFGLTWAELGHTFALRPSTAQSRVRRALLRARRCLD